MNTHVPVSQYFCVLMQLHYTCNCYNFCVNKVLICQIIHFFPIIMLNNIVCRNMFGEIKYRFKLYDVLLSTSFPFINFLFATYSVAVFWILRIDSGQAKPIVASLFVICKFQDHSNDMHSLQLAWHVIEDVKRQITNTTDFGIQAQCLLCPSNILSNAVIINERLGMSK